MTIRAPRLHADWEKVRVLAQCRPESIQVLETEGAPPFRYRFALAGRGIERFALTGPVFRDRHEVEVFLPTDYPMVEPDVWIRTPIAHPHVFPGGHVCLGAHQWNPGESLDLFLRRLRMILVWDPRIINPSSPANMEAIRWANQHPARLPFDTPEWPDEIAAPPPPPRIRTWSDR
ncbi:MAG: hypothetical protein IT337_17135 [Thermomicrobiales bacterium]|nr:hypothetical protein [Thermomicrobiales bacterium]